MYKNIFVNQCGYLPNMTKKVTIRSEHSCHFSVARTTGEHIYEGEATQKFENASTNEIVFVGDFSDLKEPGRYYVISEDMSESDTFEIHDSIYDSVLQDAMKFFYLQRCGCTLPSSAAGIYAHPACHTGMATAFGTGIKAEVSGGWHDAGDYGRYIVPAAMTIAQLFMAYEKNTAFCNIYKNDYEGKKDKSIPDFLEEIKYEILWMLKLQREDGKVYHKATPYHFCGFIMPEMEVGEMILSPVSVTATADFAASLAMAVRFFKPYDSAFAKILEHAAKKAYDTLKNFTLQGGFVNPKEITTGEYGDKNDIDERYWAAAEMYKAFGDEKYRKDFEEIANNHIYHGYGWADVGSYGNIAYITTSYPVDSILAEQIKKSMISLADERLTVVAQDGYSTSLKAEEYVWGSNFYDANLGIHLYDAYLLTGEKKYFDAAADQIHYLLGRNPMGICYLSGTGTNAMKHPHHRPSGFLGKAMPGMLAGGPCNWFADATIQGVLPKNTAPAKAYVDMTGSYSTNEVTIYWNSAFILLLTYVVS